MSGTAVDLFSGAGGVTTGLKLAGATVVSAVEMDPVAAQTYRLNHEEVNLIEEDIRNVDPLSLIIGSELGVGDLTLLTACAPCQGFSSLGKRVIADPRNDLVLTVVNFVEALRPQFVAFENVPRLANDSRFKTFVDRLRSISYGVRYGVVDAADYLTPQRRRRLVLSAVRGCADEDVPALRPATSLEPRPKWVCHAFATLPSLDSGDRLHLTPKYPKEILDRIRAIPHNGGSRVDLPEELWLECHKKMTKGASAAYGRMKWHDVAPTLTTRCISPSCGRYVHPDQDRGITLREAASLQSFPIDYQFAGGRMAIEAQIGNAVPVHLAESIWTSLTKSPARVICDDDDNVC